MRLRHAKTLITGKPGVGKTTLVQKIINRLLEVTHANRDHLPEAILEGLQTNHY